MKTIADQYYFLQPVNEASQLKCRTKVIHDIYFTE